MTISHLRPHQQMVITSMLKAMDKLTTNHVGLTMPTGAGLHHTAAQLLLSEQLREITSAGRQRRPLDVVVVGISEMRKQFQEIVLHSEEVTNQVNLRFVGPQVTYAKAVESGLVPRFWDLAVVLNCNVKTQQWWYNHMSITLDPGTSAWGYLDYHLGLALINPSKLQLVETTSINAN